jgi:hypothetical protein
MRFTIIALLGSIAFAADAPPEAQISNGAITAKFYLPDSDKGYYRGTRFDWSGVIYSLKTKNHEYFGQWFPRYDPKLHDAIMGPVEEFKTNESGLGFDDAKPGDTFVRIGVGVLKRPDNKPFDAFHTYEIVNPGKRTVKHGKDWIEFTHDLDDGKGYAYHYTKRIELVKGKPEMLITHKLKNTGKKPIPTSQYNHNFFVMDKEPTGPNSKVKFPFELALAQEPKDQLADLKSGEIVYRDELKPGESVYRQLSGFGKTASDYSIQVANAKSGAGVHIVGDQPLSKLVFWSIRTTFCPEPYIDVKADPKKEVKWTYRYTFNE